MIGSIPANERLRTWKRSSPLMSEPLISADRRSALQRRHYRKTVALEPGPTSSDRFEIATRR
ncbi:MAG: hypothetical protein MZU97_20695 [Bacillus subtilis]|nr:hypothetical protein [Bacillus subtilis]